jgi:hypothetical protein
MTVPGLWQYAGTVPAWVNGSQAQHWLMPPVPRFCQLCGKWIKTSPTIMTVFARHLPSNFAGMSNCGKWKRSRRREINRIFNRPC